MDATVEHRPAVLVHLVGITTGRQEVTAVQLSIDHPELDAAGWADVLAAMACPDASGGRLLYQPDDRVHTFALAPAGWAAARRLTAAERVA